MSSFTRLSRGTAHFVSRFAKPVSLGAALAFLLALAAPAAAQVTPAAGSTPPDDTPSIKVGTTIFYDYTYQQAPETKDADGNTINPSSFNLTRGYLNITGQLSHIVAFRLTPDITRETGAGSSLNGSMTFRVKYAFAQFNLDDWMWKGSWVRMGINQTLFLDYAEGIYRYRFQGTMFPEREGYITSADAGVSFHTNFPGNYGDFHVGFYNGDGFAKAEANDQKALQVRGTVRPLPHAAILRGWRATVFYDADNYVKNGEKKRFIFDTTFEHKYVNMGYDYLDTHDQATTIAPKNVNLHGKGWSFWTTPKRPYANGASIEALIRYDHMTPSQATPGENTRLIVGGAYWFPHQGNVSAALMLDYQQEKFPNYLVARPDTKRIFVHGLINF
jgi:hypothetical protein